MRVTNTAALRHPDEKGPKLTGSQVLQIRKLRQTMIPNPSRSVLRVHPDVLNSCFGSVPTFIFSLQAQHPRYIQREEEQANLEEVPMRLPGLNRVLLVIFGRTLYPNTQPKRGKLSAPHFGSPALTESDNSRPDSSSTKIGPLSSGISRSELTRGNVDVRALHHPFPTTLRAREIISPRTKQNIKVSRVALKWSQTSPGKPRGPFLTNGDHSGLRTHQNTRET
ncbi:hypothetical protein CRG98_009928 [Punica granatum]|uniref:Uncharacterized protein n=1 Tax=Punica granatum TaxID=22663 RepID=A0A2I0KMD0_PUNGR|nr:hypothetical protein CRG98_009928 [Punica granatum]